jgi:hypothetical protein
MPISSKSSRVSSPNRKIQDVPELPTITGVSENASLATALNVAVTPSQFGGRPEVYRATSTPGNIEGISFGSSPITVNGLTPGTNYNFTVRAETSQGASRGATALSAAANTPTGAMVPIARYVGNGAANNFTFFNLTTIPGEYQDLLLICNGFLSGSGTAFYGVRLNADSTGIYSRTTLYGNGSSPVTFRTTGQNQAFPAGAVNAPANGSSFAMNSTFYFPNFKSNLPKTFISRTSYDLNGSGEVTVQVHLYPGTGPISSIGMGTDNGNVFLASSGVWTLYGIKAA